MAVAMCLKIVPEVLGTHEIDCFLITLMTIVFSRMSWLRIIGLVSLGLPWISVDSLLYMMAIRDRCF